MPVAILADPSAANFATAFVQSFETARNEFDVQTWQATWRNPRDWTNFMLYNTNSVLTRAAVSLGVDVYYEVMKLDAVVARVGRRNWFPMLAAIEHENDFYGFAEEARKLASVRCPLKVGITYALGDPRRGTQEIIPSKVFADVADVFEQTTAVVGEEPNVEYLFLLGFEHVDWELSWKSLSFRAGEGPVGKNFVDVLSGQPLV